MAELIRVTTPAEWERARTLVHRYADALEFDLAFQDCDTEINTLAQIYGPPGGCFLLAVVEGEDVGCVALRGLEGDVCEMKRLYVLDAGRARGLGRRLAEAVILEASRLGYGRMRLDTVPSMEAARALYSSLGFREIEAYRHNPVPGTTYMEMGLQHK